MAAIINDGDDDVPLVTRGLGFGGDDDPFNVIKA